MVNIQILLKRKPKLGICLKLFLCSTMVLIIISGCTPKKVESTKKVTQADLLPVSVDSTTLNPGLAVRYIDGFWRHVNEMPKTDYILQNGKKGKPILSINHRFGNSNVFDSGRSRGVGVHLSGLIHFDEVGTYQFQAKSNDGISVFIGPVQVVNDPEWHSDRFSKPLGFNVQKSGYYNFELTYFQRKGTATLEFYWKPPGEAQFVIIPQIAYWH